MKNIWSAFVLFVLAFCVYNAVYSILSGIMLYLAIGLITMIILIPINYKVFLDAIAKHEKSQELMADKAALNLGFVILFVMGIVLWPTHIINIIRAENA